ALLAATIGITIVGPKGLPIKSLSPFLLVNKNQIYNALLFLKKENHLYHNIMISQD
ncbi:hypothetical protein BD769DRAFT_1324483, partial [Suillus cothurnatus]